MTPTPPFITIAGTIFDEPRKHRGDARHQRVVGFFFLQGINPGIVVGGRDEPCATVTANTLAAGGIVTVTFNVVALPAGVSQWAAPSPGDGIPIPAGTTCDYGGAFHKHQVQKSIDVPWHEVALDPEAPAPNPDVEV